jgi:microcystin-dependent protein
VSPMRLSLLIMLLSACPETRSPPVKYPDACGSHVECFTRGLESLNEAYKKLEEAQALALRTAPVGSVTAYAGSIEPEGWMFCDGRSLDKNDARYKALFDAIGVTHGGDANPTFQIPDYRGMFLRGVSGPSGRDPDANQRVAAGKNGSGNSGNAVGSVQLDAIQTHRHDVSYQFRATGTNGTHDADGGHDKFNSDPPSAAFSLSVLDPTNARVSSETRPVNAAVNWIIKYK